MHVKQNPTSELSPEALAGLPAALQSTIGTIKAQYLLQEQAYFRALKAGTFAREDFIETQIQFLQAVVYFSRPMAMLAARMPRPEQRWPILHNVGEEHGEGQYSMSHEHTFLTLLDRLDVSHEAIATRPQWPEVKAFNIALMGACSQDDIYLGAAVLGIIEDIFSGISAFLGDAIIERGWLERDDLIHYATHATLDIEHAADFYRILATPYEASEAEAYAIEQGLALGAYIFMQLYRGLYEGRARRWSREWRGPHSATDGWHLPTSPDPMDPNHS